MANHLDKQYIKLLCIQSGRTNEDKTHTAIINVIKILTLVSLKIPLNI